MVWLIERGKHTCGTLFGAMFWRSLPNDDVKFSYFRFWRQHEPAAVNLSFFDFHDNNSCQANESAPRPFCSTWPTWNNRKTLNLTQSPILIWRFCCSCHRSILNSVLYVVGGGKIILLNVRMHRSVRFFDVICQMTKIRWNNHIYYVSKTATRTSKYAWELDNFFLISPSISWQFNSGRVTRHFERQTTWNIQER